MRGAGWSRRTVVALAAAVLVGACDDPASLEVTLEPGHRFSQLALEVEVEDERGTRVFDEAELTPLSPEQPILAASIVPPPLTTGRLDVAERGTLRIGLRAEQDGGAVAEGEVEFAAREDFLWHVRMELAVADPTEMCFGCLGSEAFPVAESFRAAPAESLWIWWSGRREGSDVVF